MKGFCLEVSGPYACFTRPEMKVERVSYDIITPSAARAIFESILWKPAIRWRITKIDVLAPIRWISVRRNEVKSTASPRSSGIYIEEDRQQRAGLFLRDVKYRLYAEFDFLPPDRRSVTRQSVPVRLQDREESGEEQTPGDESPAKYAAMFERRARKGQCFHQPYLGCREFACDFTIVDSTNPAGTPISETRDLGWMLYDLDFTNASAPQPQFFRAQLKDGVVLVPTPTSDEMKR